MSNSIPVFEVKCHCGNPARRAQTKKPDSEGKRKYFYSCQFWKDDRPRDCNFFAWESVLLKQSQPAFQTQKQHLDRSPSPPTFQFQTQSQQSPSQHRFKANSPPSVSSRHNPYTIPSSSSRSQPRSPKAKEEMGDTSKNHFDILSSPGSPSSRYGSPSRVNMHRSASSNFYTPGPSRTAQATFDTRTHFQPTSTPITPSRVLNQLSKEEMAALIEQKDAEIAALRTQVNLFQYGSAPQTPIFQPPETFSSQSTSSSNEHAAVSSKNGTSWSNQQNISREDTIDLTNADDD